MVFISLQIKPYQCTPHVKYACIFRTKHACSYMFSNITIYPKVMIQTII